MIAILASIAPVDTQPGIDTTRYALAGYIIGLGLFGTYALWLCLATLWCRPHGRSQAGGN